MPNVLLVGSGAREHCIAEAIKKSPQNPLLSSYMSSNNPGIADFSEKTVIGDVEDSSRIVNFAKRINADMVVIGPEAPLAAGVVDSLEEAGIPSVGPKKELAQLETSKAFTRNLMEKYSVPGSGQFRAFRSMEGVESFLDELPGFVVKPDGLTGGKGVKVQGEHLNNVQEAVDYCNEVLEKHEIVVVEEKFAGEEFSLQSFTDGKTVVDCPCVQDHKRAFEDDQGPNTGGMGSYSMANHSLPFLTDNDIREAHEITVQMAKAIKKETGQYYKGVMYGGFILTKEGVKVLEYNARLGDPEAMNVLPLLETDFLDLCHGIIEGNLKDKEISFKKQATVCKYAVPEGYPLNPVKNEKIEIRKVNDAAAYYAAIDKRNSSLFMTGSRAVAFVGISDDVSQAEQIAEKAVSNVSGPVFHRKDIGTKQLLDKRIANIQSIRK